MNERSVAFRTELDPAIDKCKEESKQTKLDINI